MNAFVDRIMQTGQDTLIDLPSVSLPPLRRGCMGKISLYRIYYGITLRVCRWSTAGRGDRAAKKTGMD